MEGSERLGNDQKAIKCDAIVNEFINKQDLMKKKDSLMTK